MPDTKGLTSSRPTPVIGTERGSQSVAPQTDAAPRNSLATSILRLQPRRLDSETLGWCLATCMLISLLGDSAAPSSLRTTGEQGAARPSKREVASASTRTPDLWEQFQGTPAAIPSEDFKQDFLCPRVVTRDSGRSSCVSSLLLYFLGHVALFQKALTFVRHVMSSD